MPTLDERRMKAPFHISTASSYRSGQTVRFGYRVGDGEPIDIPIQHTCICGQTQLAGKTTALEGLIARSRWMGLTFITKRGEGSFANARRIAPYFREQADWQFVASILEASRGEKLKFERAWIIRMSKGARTLADVHRNVRQQLAKRATGKDADVYTVLDAYLEVIVPAIARVEWAPEVSLAAGISAVDMTHVPHELQHLVIKSCLDWVLEHASGTIIVIPEAWKFIPEGRMTPVKRSAEAFIRQGAAMRNYLWMDSQDLGGIDKTALRSVSVWCLGVQREANEIKRTLSNIPAGVAKPKADALATLELGQFFVCHGKTVEKVYAQPAWLSDEEAVGMSIGTLNAHALAWRAVDRAAAEPVLPPHEDPPIVTGVDWATGPDRTVKYKIGDTFTIERIPRHDGPRLRPEDDGDMTPEQEQLLRDVGTNIKHLAEEIRGMVRPSVGIAPGDAVQHGKRVTSPVTENGHTRDAVPAPVPADVFSAVRRMLLEDEQVLAAVARLRAVRPEIEIVESKKTLTFDEGSLKFRIAKLLAHGFYSEPKTHGATRSEMKRTGPDVNSGNLSRAMDDFVRDGFLTDEGAVGYRAVPDMVVRYSKE